MSNIKIGWVGLGHMGGPMARRLQNAGHPLFVGRRDNAGTRAAVQAGATVVESPAQLAKAADVVFTMVPDGPALLEIVRGPQGLLASGGAFTLVDMSTVDPASSAEVGAALDAAGAGYLRAPVTGSTAYAENGTLGIMASGPRAVYDRVLPLLQILGNRQTWLGPGEEARSCKIVINMLLANLMQALAESLVLGEKAGLPWEGMIDMIADSAAAAPIIRYKTGALKRRDFSPTATAAMMEKDLAIALDMAATHGAALPATALTRQMYTAMRAQGLCGVDMSGLLLASERLNGLAQGEAP